MGKLVIRFQGRIVEEVNLKLGDMKIGRKPPCDIILNDAGVSAEHAVVNTVGIKSTIQDLDSTNGTFIENKRIKQHQLKHGETIIVGEHTLIYRDDVNLETPASRKSSAPPGAPTASQANTTVLVSFAQLQIIEGQGKGKRMPLIKEEVKLENPGKSPAQIERTTEGYMLRAQVGPGEPRINNKPVPPGGHLLENGDIIEVAETKFQFVT